MAVDAEARARTAALADWCRLTEEFVGLPLFALARTAQQLRREGATQEEFESAAGLAWLVAEEDGDG